MRVALLVVAIAVVACGTPAANFPPTTDDQTCGIQEVHCMDQQGDRLVRNGFCCPQDSVCGGPLAPYCFKDSCCFVGHDVGPYSARAPVQQRRER